MSENKQYVTYGDCSCGSCGASKEITGCRFSLGVMSDAYIDIILGAIAKVETSNVWKMTDALSTVYRGKRAHVLDAVKACFVHAYKEDIHMTMEATISKGCPGDTDADAFLAMDDALVNEGNLRGIHCPVKCKISLYPLGVENYMKYIATVVNRAIDMGIYKESSHYATILEGDVQDIFDFFDQATAYCNKEISHYVLQATLNVNSPTEELRNEY